MLSFITETMLPIEAATTVGVSVKDDGKIGRFGTGLKYAIAGILRLGGAVTIYVGMTEYRFATRTQDIRGKAFELVTCNGERCGFTTELGKHWKPWMLFRELASNTLDEGGAWHHNHVSPSGSTSIVQVKCREVEEAAHDGAVFLGRDLPVGIASDLGAQIYAVPSQYYYYKGIRAGDWGCVAPATVDVSGGVLTEDRTLDMAKAQSEIAWAFRTCSWFDPAFMQAVITSGEDGFWELNCGVIGDGLSSNLAGFMRQRKQSIRSPKMRAALQAYDKKHGSAVYTECEAPPAAAHMIEVAKQVCRAASIDVPESVRFCRDMPDGTLGVTEADTRRIWISTKAVMLGQNEFTRTYLEEAFHAMTGHADHTQGMQDALIAIIVAMAER